MITYRFGYDIATDLHHGVTIVWGNKRKRMISLHWDWPHLIWFNRSWAVNEKGYMQGMPIWRKNPKKWLLRGLRLDAKFRYVSDCARERLTPWNVSRETWRGIERANRGELIEYDPTSHD